MSPNLIGDMSLFYVTNRHFLLKVTNWVTKLIINKSPKASMRRALNLWQHLEPSL